MFHLDLIVLFAVSFLFIVSSVSNIYTLSLHDALPIYSGHQHSAVVFGQLSQRSKARRILPGSATDAPIERFCVLSLSPDGRSEEHTSELQSPYDLVCRLLLEKKKIDINTLRYTH